LVLLYNLSQCTVSIILNSVN
jgi:hypothetical protein